MPKKANKIYGLEDWVLDKNYPNNKRIVEVSIHLQYPDITPFYEYEPAVRKKKIQQDQKEKFNKLIATKLFDDFKLIGKPRRPSGITVTIPYSHLAKIKGLDYISSIYIKKIDSATKIIREDPEPFYCVKMTVAIEVEGRTSGIQTIEERYVLIKAKSRDDAYKKLEKRKNDYAEPYLNSDGHFVRWKIESFDDYFETEISGFADLNNPNGAEVFSKFKGRKLKKENIWDGKSK